jgi:hypothetical protein
MAPFGALRHGNSYRALIVPATSALQTSARSLVGHEVKAIAFYGAHKDLEGPVTEGTVLMEFLVRLTLCRHRRRLSFSLAHVSPAAPSALQSPACARPAASQAHRASVSAASP